MMPSTPCRARWRKWYWAVLVIALTVAALQFLPPRGEVPGRNAFRAHDAGRPLNIAHRGGRGLFPENTLEAFAGAVALGCDCLETDLRLTRDGVLVTCHDPTIERTSNGHGLIREHTLAELKALNFGERFTNLAGVRPYAESPARIATLEELFGRHTNTLMILELKDREADGREAAGKLASLIQRHGRERTVLVASFAEATLARFRERADGRVLVSASRDRARTFVILNRLRLDWFTPPGDAAWQLPLRSSGLALDTPRLLGAARRRNQAVHYWTINDPAEMRRLAALGADGLITDRPDVLKETLAAPRPAADSSPAR